LKINSVKVRQIDIRLKKTEHKYFILLL